MIIYAEEIARKAKEFMLNNENIVVNSLVEEVGFYRYDMDALDEAFRSSITDIYYTLSDSAWILENCDNEETDSELWEGASPRTAVATQAAHSFSNEVWTECERLYELLQERMYKDVDMTEPASGDEDEVYDTSAREDAAKRVLAAFRAEGRHEPVEPGYDDERVLLDDWIERSNNAGTIGGYPLGSSYISPGYGVGYGMPDQIAYVRFDEEVAAKLPHLSGKSMSAIKEYVGNVFGTEPKSPSM